MSARSANARKADGARHHTGYGQRHARPHPRFAERTRIVAVVDTVTVRVEDARAAALVLLVVRTGVGAIRNSIAVAVARRIRVERAGVLAVVETVAVRVLPAG